MTLHFAYASNMDRAAMARRCPGAVPLGRAVLNDHRFIITTEGYASVLRMPGEVVHGVLWRLTARDLSALNAYEGVDSGLYSRIVIPVQSDGRSVKALVYLGRSRSPGKPKPGYMDDVIAAAREWAMPWDYVQSLTRWTQGGWRGARETDTGDIG